MKIELGFASRPSSAPHPYAPRSQLATKHSSTSSQIYGITSRLPEQPGIRRTSHIERQHELINLADQPIRVVPFENESLNSYLLRLTTENGFLYATLARHLCIRARFQDWDICDNELQLERISQSTKVLLPRLREMMTRSVHGYPFFRYGLLSSLLGTDMKRSQQFCPDCLREDSTPYLRKEWRNSYTVACGKHRRLLSTCCTYCNTPFRPFTTPKQETVLFNCDQCSARVFDASEVPAHQFLADRALRLQNQVLSSLEEGWAQEFLGSEMHVFPFMEGIRLLCNLALSEKFLKRHMDAFDEVLRCELAKHAALRTEKSKRVNTEEAKSFRWIDFSPASRAAAMTIVSDWINKWPQALKTEIGSDEACHFIWTQVRPKLKFVPHWIESGFSEIFYDLKKRNRSRASKNKSHRARELLQKQGYYDVRRHEIKEYVAHGTMPSPRHDGLRRIVEQVRAHRNLIRLEGKREKYRNVDYLKSHFQKFDTHRKNEELKNHLGKAMSRVFDRKLHGALKGKKLSVADKNSYPGQYLHTLLKDPNVETMVIRYVDQLVANWPRAKS